MVWVEEVADADRMRDAWVTWEEGGRLPDVIFELYSKSNRLKHRKQKKELYSKVFRTAETPHPRGERDGSSRVAVTRRTNPASARSVS